MSTLKVRCPECGDTYVNLVAIKNKHGQYRCQNCGHYFIETTTQLNHVDGKPICANCEFFDWIESTEGDTGTCSESELVVGVNARSTACSAFKFFPPCLR